jgi:hypothetical protein
MDNTIEIHSPTGVRRRWPWATPPVRRWVMSSKVGQSSVTSPRAPAQRKPSAGWAKGLCGVTRGPKSHTVGDDLVVITSTDSERWAGIDACVRRSHGHYAFALTSR